LQQKEHERQPRLFFQSRTLDFMEREGLAADLLLSLFITSALCYRKSSICEPFPEQFRVEGTEERNYEDLV
jgi:hypothetical protein